MDIFNLLSVIGAVTGSSAAITLLRTYFKEKAAIKISFPYPDLNVYFPCNEKQDGYSRTHRLIVNTRIENHSSLPISIMEFNLVSQQLKIIETSSSGARAVGIYPVSIFNFDGKKLRYTLDLGKEQLTLPFTIQPYGVAEGFAFFVSSINPKYESFTCSFGVLTTRGFFRNDVKISIPTPIDPASVKKASTDYISH